MYSRLPRRITAQRIVQTYLAVCLLSALPPPPRLLLLLLHTAEARFSGVSQSSQGNCSSQSTLSPASTHKTTLGSSGTVSPRIWSESRKGTERGREAESEGETLGESSEEKIKLHLGGKFY